MLHEILFALLGITGSVIIEVPLTEDNLHGLEHLDESGSSDGTQRAFKFVVNPDLRFLSLAEID